MLKVLHLQHLIITRFVGVYIELPLVLLRLGLLGVQRLLLIQVLLRDLVKQLVNLLLLHLLQRLILVTLPVIQRLLLIILHLIQVILRVKLPLLHLLQHSIQRIQLVNQQLLRLIQQIQRVGLHKQVELRTQ